MPQTSSISSMRQRAVDARQQERSARADRRVLQLVQRLRELRLTLEIAEEAWNTCMIVSLLRVISFCASALFGSSESARSTAATALSSLSRFATRGAPSEQRRDAAPRLLFLGLVGRRVLVDFLEDLRACGRRSDRTAARCRGACLSHAAARCPRFAAAPRGSRGRRIPCVTASSECRRARFGAPRRPSSRVGAPRSIARLELEVLRRGVRQHHLGLRQRLGDRGAPACAAARQESCVVRFGCSQSARSVASVRARRTRSTLDARADRDRARRPCSFFSVASTGWRRPAARTRSRAYESRSPVAEVDRRALLAWNSLVDGFGSRIRRRPSILARHLEVIARALVALELERRVATCWRCSSLHRASLAR